MLGACAVFACIPAVASAVTIVNEGTITAADPDQAFRLHGNDPPSTCAAPKTRPPLDSTTAFYNYDVHSITNDSSSSQCVTVELDPKACVGGTGTERLQSLAYSPYSNVSNTYLADIGALPATANTPKSYSFTVPAGGNFDVVVLTASNNATCDGYKLTVSYPDPPSPGQQQPTTGTGTTGGGGPTAPGSVFQAISGLISENPVFRVDTQGQAAQRRRRSVPKGTRFRFRLATAGRVDFTIERRSRGRRVGRRCRRQTRRNRTPRRCVRYVPVRRFARQGKAGQNVVPFSGRIRVRGRTRSLRPGRYRASVRAVDGAGNRSALARVAFRVVR